VSLLDRFEQSMERLMEGTIGTVFRQSMQPAELGKRLQRAMIDQRRVSVGTTIVPNRFVVRLHPKDFAQFADYQQGLSRQMEAWLAQVATERNFSVLDRIQVTLQEDSSAPRRMPRIEAAITDMHQPRPTPVVRPQSRPAPSQATETFQPVRSGNQGDLLLRVTSGTAAGKDFMLPSGASTIGRSPENALIIDSPDVSRRHARFEYFGGQVRLYDLNSTNGTRVNGEAIRVTDIFPGDTITLGSEEMRLVRSPSSETYRD
jgi:pSer/pThr/pTyr-binding forkhead associated (FHA) protein